MITSTILVGNSVASIRDRLVLHSLRAVLIKTDKSDVRQAAAAVSAGTTCPSRGARLLLGFLNLFCTSGTTGLIDIPSGGRDGDAAHESSRWSSGGARARGGCVPHRRPGVNESALDASYTSQKKIALAWAHCRSPCGLAAIVKLHGDQLTSNVSIVPVLE
ncbi:hypothetical protein BC834DRAFT_340820 [Gloeopeniophorella convolvens]|nr:hypothetical protein BC834DRAFT_340820 [Gloeopeniophorella convolvens]